jgi:hypothetical protein
MAMARARIKKWMWWALAAIVAFQIYFVRELFAAELLFGLGFLLLVAFGGLFYLAGAVGERGLDWASAHVHFPMSFLTSAARWSLSRVEALSKKTFRHPRSESVQ